MRGLARTISLVGSIPAEYLCFFDPLRKASMGAVLVLVGSILDESWRNIEYLEQRVEEQDQRNHQTGNFFDQLLLKKLYSFEVARKTGFNLSRKRFVGAIQFPSKSENP